MEILVCGALIALCFGSGYWLNKKDLEDDRAKILQRLRLDTGYIEEERLIKKLRSIDYELAGGCKSKLNPYQSCSVCGVLTCPYHKSNFSYYDKLGNHHEERKKMRKAYAAATEKFLRD